MIKHDKIILHLHGKNLGIIIGKHGKTLDALQYLTNLTTNQGQDTRHFIMLDVEIIVIAVKIPLRNWLSA